ncbi:MAG: hypothetical protein BCS36_06890 [Desulfovibrio sp. MES5]|nr:MAG: hypothetical protein BCS36_06890 [Desulfovibrio sp. MES5]
MESFRSDSAVISRCKVVIFFSARVNRPQPLNIAPVTMHRVMTRACRHFQPKAALFANYLKKFLQRANFRAWRITGQES